MVLVDGVHAGGVMILKTVLLKEASSDPIERSTYRLSIQSKQVDILNGLKSHRLEPLPT